LKISGTQSITATDTTTSTITGSQSGITVTAAAASALVVAGFPSPTTAGISQSITETRREGYGNTAAGYTGIVHFTSSDAKAALPSNYTFTSADKGVHPFNATLKISGTQSITATDTTTSTITGSQSGITVSAAAASALVVAGFPSPTTAGISQS